MILSDKKYIRYSLFLLGNHITNHVLEAYRYAVPDTMAKNFYFVSPEPNTKSQMSNNVENNNIKDRRRKVSLAVPIKEETQRIASMRSKR